MPRLLLFAPFERAVIAEEDKSLSLIGLIRTLLVTVPANTEPPKSGEGTVAKWYAVSIFDRESDTDEGKTYEQWVRLILSDGTDALGVKSEFPMLAQTHHNVVKLDVLPAAPPGDCSLELLIREKGAGDWRKIADYPVTISHRVAVPS